MTFSDVGASYGEQLSRGLRLTGEGASYFAGRRVDRIRELANARGMRVRVVIDFGCGGGAAFPALRAAFGDARIIGFEPERALRDVAVGTARQSQVEILDADTLDARGDADIVYCNGVFHHIPVTDRLKAMGSLRAALRPGGLAFVWENSPFNPGTRLVMSRIPFDRDARLLTPGELRALQQSCGLTHLLTEYHFVFPRALGFLRSAESMLRSFPLGGQYLVAGRARQ
jgi:trans-aconitate methyltransferase